MAPAIDSASQSMSRNGNGGLPVNGGSSEGNDKSNRHQNVTWKNKLRAFVVDNERLCRVLEKAILCAHGVETEAVENGEAAVELIASGATFNLIVFDMFLPVMSGPETARQIRAMGIRTKMLGLTALIFEKDEQEFLAAGVDEFIEKPLSPDWLVPFLTEIDNQI